MKSLLCNFGVHRPLSGHLIAFTDIVSRKTVFYAACPCGKRWMVDSLNCWGGFKVAARWWPVEVE